jgi:glycerol kinase
MSEWFILSVDQSTSATKAVLFNSEARLIAKANKEHKQYFPQAGWVEHDPEEIFINTVEVINEIVSKSKVPVDNIKCLSITNQRETVVVWEKTTGKPICNAAVWQCLRGTEKCNELKSKGYDDLINKKTGLIIDPYFSASKLNWILNNDISLQKKAMKGQLLVGTIDSWLIWKLTNGKVHATDFSNACRTLLLNINNLQWDEELCRLFKVPIFILPDLKHSDDIFGYTNVKGIFKNEIPICGVMGDSHAALFGQRCYSPGMAKVTYGTGSSVMMNIGDSPIQSPKGLVTSVGYSIKSKTNFVFEGNIHTTGYTIKWLANALKLISDSSESESIAKSVDSTEGVYFVPAFSGLGAPYWNNNVRAAIIGIEHSTNKAHIVRAALESIAYQVKDILDLMTIKARIPLNELRVDGGPTNNNFLMQFQSDILNTNISVSDISEASALGAALAGGLAIGLWKNLSDIEKLYKSRNKLSPSMSDDKRLSLYSGWKNAVNLLCKS